MKKLAILSICTILGTEAFALSKEIRFDMLKTKLSEELKSKEYNSALDTISELKNMGVSLPNSLVYFEAKAMFENGQKAGSYKLFEKYLNKDGKGAKYYKEALAYIIKAEPEKKKVELERQRKLERQKETERQKEKLFDIENESIYRDKYSGDSFVYGGRGTWWEANKKCESLIYAGFDNWYLPDENDLKPILSDYHITDYEDSYKDRKSDKKWYKKEINRNPYIQYGSASYYVFKEKFLSHKKIKIVDSIWSSNDYNVPDNSEEKALVITDTKQGIFYAKSKNNDYSYYCIRSGIEQGVNKEKLKKLNSQLKNSWIDIKTNLMWQNEKYDKEDMKKYQNNGLGGKVRDRYHYDNYDSGDSAKEYCGKLVLDGYNDWRLPTIFELISLSNINLYSYVDSEGLDKWINSNKNKKNTSSDGSREFFIKKELINKMPNCGCNAVEFIADSSNSNYYKKNHTAYVDFKKGYSAVRIMKEDSYGKFYNSRKFYTRCVRKAK